MRRTFLRHAGLILTVLKGGGLRGYAIACAIERRLERYIVTASWRVASCEKLGMGRDAPLETAVR